MAHFAEIDATNTVTQVLVVGDDQEHRGQEYLADDLGLGGTWIQTSYNTQGNVHSEGGTPLRYNYAGIGSTYDPAGDAFHGPSPFPSWALDANYVWQPPVPQIDGYRWDEETVAWIQPDTPFPSWQWVTNHWEPPVPHPIDNPTVDDPFYEWDEATTSWIEVTT